MQKKVERMDWKKNWHKGDFYPEYQRRKAEIVLDARMEVGMGSKSKGNSVQVMLLCLASGHEMSDVAMLGLRVRILLRAWMFISCVCCVLCR